MGQFTLGLRSLLVRSVIFVIMAALLAWALGGTLFPRPQTADFQDQTVRYNGGKWFWRVLVGGKNAGEVRWNLINENADGKENVFADTAYVEVAGPVAGDDGLYYAGRERDPKKRWELVRIDANGKKESSPMPDRLAVEQQLERVKNGLPLQKYEAIMSQRARLLDPPGNSADE